MFPLSFQLNFHEIMHLPSVAQFKREIMNLIGTNTFALLSSVPPIPEFVLPLPDPSGAECS